ncbi:MAG: integrase arm-type DNA-binding domain-containing protein [Deltaproteobacteria bacterium]|jgi:integrase|nr:integrase arm-type DNA-binding domain-containing protein [Deltaproteobacteria bacterium]
MRCKLIVKDIKKLPIKNKPYKVSDGAGLILHVSVKGTKVWRYVYRYQGKQQTLTIGPYPEISLNEAREIHENARRELKRGINPAGKKHFTIVPAPNPVDNDTTFETLALEFIANHAKYVKQETIAAIKSILDRRLLPDLGHKPANRISPRELSLVIDRIKSEGYDFAAKRALSLCGQIFRFAIGKGFGDFGLMDITIGLKAETPPIKGLAFLQEPEHVGKLLRDIDNCACRFKSTGSALRLAPLVFLRPKELVSGEWDEVNLAEGIWTIPGHKMKMKKDHIVPLARQAIDILESIRPMNPGSRYMFPSPVNNGKHLEKHSLTVALRSMGYGPEDQTVHGFRKIASTFLNELGFNGDWIERQLSHTDSNKVRGTYNKAEYLNDRRKMMQEWADYLDKLKGLAFT